MLEQIISPPWFQATTYVLCEGNPLMSLYYFDMLFMHMKPNKSVNINGKRVKICVYGLSLCVLSNDSHLVAD